MKHEAPWLYDIDADAEAELSDSSQCDAEMGLLSVLDPSSVHRDHAKLVRCHGVDAKGAPCTRTSMVTTDYEFQASQFCYRHCHQKQRKRTNMSSRTALPCSCGSSGLCCFTGTRRMWCSMLLAMSSLVLVVLGAIKKDATLCVLGAVGLFASMVWMCVVVCELLCRAVAPAIAAHVAFRALHAQVTDKCGSRDDHCDTLDSRETADIA